MKTWTAFTAKGRAPVLVPEGFSWLAMEFGPIWLAQGRAWSAAIVAATVYVVLASFAPIWTLVIPAFSLGLFGHDIRRLALQHRGYALVHVVAASTEDDALARLLARRPDLIPDAVIADLPG